MRCRRLEVRRKWSSLQGEQLTHLKTQILYICGVRLLKTVLLKTGSSAAGNL